ncbi:hypothetical protein BC938DRAFT_474212 [Jimgerdemannia flammicorona]|uniref:Cation-transporting P-type ATPase C-terminal domain-containing protein n=1 Tax=Jimgerdemannia flammicorona TaxID=994334 RepID=A0A433Q2L6_9FUNG|nr:hypothetical protein BC938DRAFT_474212 [Jimgerdemannia flammicorona]
MGVPLSKVTVRALDLVTIVVPPALPATMSIGTGFAISRLKRRNIFCISPPRVNIGGKIDCMCFDKTGTLTEDGLDVLGVRCVDRATDMFSEEMKEINRLEMGNEAEQQWDADDGEQRNTASLILHAMTTCHALRLVQGELIGDPLDLKMFEFTRWELEESGGETSHEGTNATTIGVAGPSRKRDLESGFGSAAGLGLNGLGVNGVRKGGIVSTVVRPPGGKRFELDVGWIGGSPSDGKVGFRFVNESPQPPLELGIIRCFEFVSSLRRMSVVVRRLSRPALEVYVKGAPEVMSEICLKETMPRDYQERLHYYTHRGYRVIACASKSLGNVKWHKLQKLKRQEVETGLTFLGFVIFENKLKPGTTSVVRTLQGANIRQVMCTGALTQKGDNIIFICIRPWSRSSCIPERFIICLISTFIYTKPGDNVLTAISVSRECELVDPRTEIFVPRFTQGGRWGDGSSTTPDATVVWESVLEEGQVLDSETLQLITRNSSRLANYNYTRTSPFSPQFRYDLAITGDVFRWMVDYSPPDTLSRMLVKSRVFARMSPDEKHELVEKLQTLGYCVGFCGDGANDCGALKAADVGISLSEAEASVAAPFTSKTMDIGCVVDVIREGRAALVTSFSCFKYMALYSIIQFTSVTLLYAFDTNLGDFQIADCGIMNGYDLFADNIQFLYIDLFLILPIAVFMGRTEAYPYLHPKRPTASLVSKKVLTSLIGQIIFCSGFQGLIYILVRRQEWYEPPKSDPIEKNIECFENTVLFMLSCFQYILIAVVFGVGPPYRKAMWTNVPFIVTILLLVLLTVWTVLIPPASLVDILELLSIPLYFRQIILVLGAINFGISWVTEKYAFPGVAKWIGRVMEGGWRDVWRGREGYSAVEKKSKRHQKEWKRIVEELGGS